MAPPLCVVDDRLQPHWLLADGVVQIDARTIDVHLKAGLPVGADDVVFTFSSILDPAMASPHRARLEMLADVTALDARTVRFRLTRAYAPFVVDGLCAVGILGQRDCAGGDVCRTHPVGAGPFTRVDDGRRPDRLMLRRATGDQPGPDLDVRVVRDGSARLMGLMAGDIDVVMGDVAPWDVAPLQRVGLSVSGTAGVGFSYLGINTRSGPLGDERVRRALSLAIDTKQLVAGRLQGRGTRTSGLLPPGHWAKDASLRPIDVDRDAARALLREAGVPAGATLRLLSSTDRLRQSSARAIAAQLAEVGLHVELEVRDWSVVYERLKAGRFELVLAKWTPVVDPDLLTTTVHSGSIPGAGGVGSGGNRGAFVDPEVDRLLDQARAIVDLDTRARLYGTVEARLQQQVPFVPLWCDEEVIATSARVRSSDGLTPLRPWRTGSLMPLVEATLVPAGATP
jgi:peptide/nickel transport system substrate-binding protein